MKSIIRSGLMALICVCLFSLQTVWAGNISETYKYAWSENVSWQNWRSTHAQVTVEATYLTGYVWAENAGWIKLGSTPSGGSYANTTLDNWGVNRDGSGNLSGYAWSENVGWINFNPTRGGVTINTDTNKFDGYAWGERIGWIHFQNVSPEYYVMLETTAPTVTTQAVTEVTTTTATGNGNVTDLGVPNPTQHGVCWSTSTNPTVALPTKTEQGVKSTTGAFTSSITGLSPNTTYYVRAYATNAGGTSYGNSVMYASGLYVSSNGDCGPKSPCYDSIQGAIDVAATESVIFVKQGAYEELITLGSTKTLTIKGGYDLTYTQQTANTTFIEATGPTTIKASSGSLKFQMVNIK